MARPRPNRTDPNHGDAVPLKSEPKNGSTPQALAPAEGLTGVAFSVEASNDTGQFCNYRICTLFIVDGEIVHVERTQEFAAFEAIARTEMLVNSSLWNLSSRYKPGLFQSLGGDARDELMNRLKKTNPELLERIKPALGIPRGEARD